MTADTRREFLKHTAAAAALGVAGSAATGAAMAAKHFVCVTCGMQYAASERPPDGCPVCLDERQYVGHGGQQWTTLDEYRKTHKNVLAEDCLFPSLLTRLLVSVLTMLSPL